MGVRTQNVNIDLRNPWICNPYYDLSFFSLIWWIPFCIGCFFGIAPYVGLGLFFILYHVLIRLPHFVATFPVTYLRQENWNHYRQHWIRYGLNPLIIMALYFHFGTSPNDGWISRVLATITIIWGLQHIAFQNYGILQIYHSRNGTFRPSLKRIETWIFALLVVPAAILHDVVRLWWPNLISHSALNLILLVQYTIFAALGVAYARELRGIKNWQPAVLFLISSVATMTYWPIYDRVPAISMSLFFYMFNGQHCLSYVGLTNYMLAGRRDRRNATAIGLTVSSTFIYVGLLVLASGMAVAFYLWQNPRYLQNEFVSADRRYRLFGSFEGFFVAHYYLESIAWKFKDVHARNNMFSLVQPRFKIF